jgi:hypothetical protein
VRQAWRPPIYSSSAATTAALERECAAAMVHRGAPSRHHTIGDARRPRAAPPLSVQLCCLRHRLMSSSPGCVDPPDPTPLRRFSTIGRGPPRRGSSVLPSPALSSALSGAVPFILSAVSAAAMRTRTRLQGGSWGHWPAAQLEKDAARAASCPVKFLRGWVSPLCFASLSLCVL